MYNYLLQKVYARVELLSVGQTFNVCLYEVARNVTMSKIWSFDLDELVGGERFYTVGTCQGKLMKKSWFIQSEPAESSRRRKCYQLIAEGLTQGLVEISTALLGNVWLRI